MGLVAFDNSYRRLPERFYASLGPARVAAPRLIAFHHDLATELGMDAGAAERDAAALFSGNALAEGAEPIALAYAGHQFGNFVPQLGDGRALLLGEVVGRDGKRRDIQLKGSGPTPFSRRGDGRAALGPVLREYIVSEAMHAMGVPTTRALAAVATGETVWRERPLPGAVLTRVAASHIRIGTFQFFAARQDAEALKLLADYVIDRHYPEMKDAPQPYLALLGAVAARQARLIAKWMAVGFVHGVMNTDNMAVSGETIDYGPCAFLDAFDRKAVFSSIDRGGRYAYANQPAIAQWNLARLAETLLFLIDPDIDAAIKAATATLEAFPAEVSNAWEDEMRRKLGLTTADDGDIALTTGLLDLMEAGGVDFTLAFRALSHGETALSDAGALFPDRAAFDAWASRWTARLAAENASPSSVAARMRAVNPAIIPRNHLIEQAIAAAVEREDFAPFTAMAAATRRPFDETPELAAYRTPPTPEERVCETFCGT